MYCLPCPQCNANLEVGPSKAGGQVACSQCGHDIAVPKLGQLRQLPVSAGTHDESPAAAVVTSGSGSVAFVPLAILAAGLLLAAGFCGVRWALTDAPITTQQHVDDVKQVYREVSAAQLVREWEDMEKSGIDLPLRFQYRTAELMKAKWGRNALIFGGAGLACIALAAVTGTKRRSARSRETYRTVG